MESHPHPSSLPKHPGPNSSRRVLFLLTREALVACNSGRPFSEAGLSAICSSNLSDKDSAPITTTERAKAVIDEIREQRTQSYGVGAGPKDLKEHLKGERETGQSYGARVILELLQNADDAMGETPIGYKGLGFKSILNVTDSPRLYSGPVSIHFGREASAQHLRASGRDVGADDVPVLRLPFWYSEPEEARIQDLRSEFNTVLVMPFHSDEARTRIRDEWSSIKESTSILVFLQNIEHVEWEGDESAPSWHCDRRTSHRVIVSQGGEAKTNSSTWLVAPGPQGLGAAAVALNEDGTPAPISKHPHLCSFFPIHKEHNPFPNLLLHGQFPLDPSREFILKNITDTDAANHDIAVAVCTILALCRELGPQLDLLEPRIPPDGMTDVEQSLWEKVRDRYLNTPVPGNPDRIVRSLRILPNTFYATCLHQYQKQENIRNGIKLDAKKWLSDYRPGGLEGLPFIDEPWESPKREQTLKALVSDCELTEDQFKAYPLFPVDGQAPPASPSDFMVVEGTDKGIPKAPDGIPFRTLRIDAAKALPPSGAHQSTARDYLRSVAGLQQFSVAKVLQHAIAPHAASADDEQLEVFLFHLTRDKFPDPRDFNLLIGWRRELAEKVTVRTESSGRRPAIECYAGKEWTDSAYLEEVFAERPDRHFIAPPTTDGDEIGEWVAFYKWLGVGFCPKVIPVPGVPSLDEPEEGDKAGPEWTGESFPLDDPPPEWNRYCAWVKATSDPNGDMVTRHARLKRNWMIDCGPADLAKPGAWKAVAENWTYYTRYRDALWFESSNRQQDYDNRRRAGESYVTWIIRNFPWVPVAGDSRLLPLKEAYIKGPITERLKGWAPEIRVSPPDQMAQDLRIPRTWEDLDEGRWRRWMDEILTLEATPPLPRGTMDTIQLVYRALLSNASGDFKTAKLWATRIDKTNPEYTALFQTADRNGVFYVDRPDLDGLPFPGIGLFPVRLGGLAQKAKALLGLKLLSESIVMEMPSGINATAATEFSRRLSDRIPMLVVACAGEGASEAVREELAKAFAKLRIRVCEKLRVDVRIGGSLLAGSPLHFPFLIQPNLNTLWLDEGFAFENHSPLEQAWAKVAAALLWTPGVSDSFRQRGPLLTSLLRMEHPKDIEGVLRDEGLTEDDIRQFKPADPPPRVKPDDKPQTEPTNQEPKAPPADTTTNPSSPPETPGGPGTTADQETKTRQGLAAQEWLRRELQRHLAHEDWSISESAVRDSKSRESDIVLTHPERGEFHLEVKSCRSTEIFWSQQEVEKAGDWGDRYLMAVLTPGPEGTDQPYTVFWFRSPLEQLSSCDRFCRWNWTPHDEPYELERWQIPESKFDRHPNRFSFRIVIPEQLLSGLPTGASAFARIL